MTQARISGVMLRGVSSCVPEKTIDNQTDLSHFDPKEIKKVVAMAGVRYRKVADRLCSSDLCLEASRNLLEKLDWAPESVDALIMVTQTPDYFLPSTASLLHRDLLLKPTCASFDVGLGCSGYPYGMWLGSMMIATGSAKRVLVLHGETPSRFTHPEDRSTVLLFGDAGSATALEAGGNDTWSFSLYSDGKGYDDLIIPGGGFREPDPESTRDQFLHMNGGNLFNFTVKRVPEMVRDNLSLSELSVEDIDAFVFHQSNKFIMRHIANKLKLPTDKTPVILNEFGNSGGPSVPLAMTQYFSDMSFSDSLTAMLLGYGVGLSWGAATLKVNSDTVFAHAELAESQA